MNRMQAQVADFHEATGSDIGESPAFGGPEQRDLRAKLILEEAVETVAALGFTVEALLFATPNKQNMPIATFTKSYPEPDLVETIDGICDLMYVGLGTAVAMGVDIEPHFDEVHRANMTKIGGPVREDGKRLKPEGWLPPDHEKIIHRQIERAREWTEMEQRFWDQRETSPRVDATGSAAARSG